MKTIAWLLALTSASLAFAQSAPIRISFKPGAISHEWRGTIYAGRQDFVLRLGKSQSFRLDSPDVYTWEIVTPDKKVLGCGNPPEGSYCAPGGDITVLPLNGDYVVRTTYRMSGCANCPVARSRDVNVVFVAH